MLVLARKIGEKIIINDEIEIVVLDSGPSGVKLGVSAPKSVSIYREELYREIKATNKTSNTASFDALNELQKMIPAKKSVNEKVLENLTTKLKND